MDQSRGGGTAWALGSRTMTKRQVANIIKDCVDFEQQMLKVLGRHLLLKRQGLIVNMLEMLMRLGGTPIAPSDGTVQCCDIEMGSTGLTGSAGCQNNAKHGSK